MNQIKILLIVLLYCTTIKAQEQSFKNEIDWPKFLSNHDLIFDTLNGYYFDGAFLGNGLIGAMIYRKDTNSISWSINRSDITDSCNGTLEGYNKTRIPIGKFTLKIRGHFKSFSARLDLWNAELRGTIITDIGKINLISYIHATGMVMVTSLEGIDGEKDPEMIFEPDLSACIKEWVCCDIAEKGTYQEPNPKALNEKKDGVFYHSQTLQTKEVFTVAWTKIKKSNKNIFFSTVAFDGKFSANKLSAKDLMSKVINQDLEVLAEGHRKWWHDFYPKSFISIPDTKLESFYWIQMYKLASATRENGVIVDILGPWYLYSPWRAIWWNLNVQLTYMSMYTSNHLELGVPLYKTLDKNFQNLVTNVPPEHRHNAAGIGRVSGYDCISELNMNDTFPFGGKELGNLPWLMYNYYMQYRYSMEDKMLKQNIFPLLRRSINLYINIMEEGTDGKIHLPETFSPEYKAAKDCNYDLALFRWGCSTLLDITKRLNIDDPLIPQWKDISKRLVDYPTNVTGLMIGKDVALTESHRHFVHMIGVYPLHILTSEEESNKKLIEKSLDHWLSLDKELAGYTYTIASSISSSMGKGDDALKYIYKFLPYMSSNTHYREAGPCIETPLSGSTAINEMLLQSWGNKISVFPALPSSWKNVSFSDLRTEGSFLISAKRSNGKTEFIKIESLNGEPCVVKSDLKFEEIKIVSDKKIKFKKVNENTIELSLKRGEIAIITTKIFKNDFIIEPVSPQPEYLNSFGKKAFYPIEK